MFFSSYSSFLNVTGFQYYTIQLHNLLSFDKHSYYNVRAIRESVDSVEWDNFIKFKKLDGYIKIRKGTENIYLNTYYDKI
ncbi:hypothetical protein JCM12294_33590 [Desulfocicer niacini]